MFFVLSYQSTMQAAGYFVGAAAKLASGMKLRKDYFHGRHSHLGVDIHRHTSAVILYRDRIVGMDRHIDVIAESCQGLVHRIVYNLINQVMKSP